MSSSLLPSSYPGNVCRCISGVLRVALSHAQTEKQLVFREFTHRKPAVFRLHTAKAATVSVRRTRNCRHGVSPHLLRESPSQQYTEIQDLKLTRNWEREMQPL